MGRRQVKHWLYRARFNWAGRGNPGSFPVHVDIELAGKCQLACRMCPYGTGDFDESLQGMMPLEMAYEAVEQAAAGGAKSIKFNFRGEPGLYKKLAALVYDAKARGIVETAINTNLTAFTKERLTSLVDAGLDLMIVSMDGMFKNTYEHIRQKGDWEKLLENLDHVSQLPVRLRIQMVEQETNRDQVDLFKWAVPKQWGAEAIVQKVRDSNQGERKRCPQPYQRLVVAWDGKVFACCSNWNNEHPVGQFPRDSLSQIWNKSVALKELRIQANLFKRNPCKDCTVGGSYK